MLCMPAAKILACLRKCPDSSELLLFSASLIAYMTSTHIFVSCLIYLFLDKRCMWKYRYNIKYIKIKMCTFICVGVFLTLCVNGWSLVVSAHTLILAQSHTFFKIDHAINSMVILLPSANSRRVVVSYKRKYVHEVLVNRLVKLAQEDSVVRWSDHPDMTITVDLDVKHQNKQNKLFTWIYILKNHDTYWARTWDFGMYRTV